MRSTLSLLLLAVSTAAAGEPLQALPQPKIVAHSSLAQPAGEVPLAVGKFVWLTMANHEGPVTFDVAGSKAVFIFNAKPGVEYDGMKEGESNYGAHTAPDSKSDVLKVTGVSAGVVNIAAWGIKDGKPAKLATIVLSVAGARPPPVPPKPDPIPVPPDPTGEGAWIEVIEETSERSLDTAAILGDLKFWQSLEPKGHSWRHYDKDAKDLPKGHYKGDKLPILMIVSQKGVQLYRGPLPSSTAEIARIVTDTTGVK